MRLIFFSQNLSKTLNEKRTRELWDPQRAWEKWENEKLKLLSQPQFLSYNHDPLSFFSSFLCAFHLVLSLGRSNQVDFFSSKFVKDPKWNADKRTLRAPERLRKWENEKLKLLSQPQFLSYNFQTLHTSVLDTGEHPQRIWANLDNFLFFPNFPPIRSDNLACSHII